MKGSQRATRARPYTVFVAMLLAAASLAPAVGYATAAILPPTGEELVAAAPAARASAPMQTSLARIDALIHARDAEALSVESARLAALAGVAAPPPGSPFADDYAWQFAMLQNPVANPGFEMGQSGTRIPGWWDDGAFPESDDAVVDGRLHVRGSITQYPGTTTLNENDALPLEAAGVPLTLSPYVGFSSVSLAVSQGVVDVTLHYATIATSEYVTLQWHGVTASTPMPLTLQTATVANPIPGISEEEVLAQSAWMGIRLDAVGGEAVVDDVVLDGVAYGDPLVSFEWDDPAPDGTAGIIGPNEVDEEVNAALYDQFGRDLREHRNLHDGIAVLIELTQTGNVASNGVATTPIDGLYDARIAFVAYTPSGPVPLDPASAGSRVTLWSFQPTEQVDGTPAPVVHDLAVWTPILGTTDWTLGDLTFPAITLTGVRLPADGDADATTIVGATWARSADAWRDPTFAGFVTGWHNPAKLASFALPMTDALDLTAAPVPYAPNQRDSDMDTWVDAVENAAGSDPYDPRSTPDNDGELENDLNDGVAVIVEPQLVGSGLLGGPVELGADGEGNYRLRAQVWGYANGAGAPLDLQDDAAYWLRLYEADTLPAPLADPALAGAAYYEARGTVADVRVDATTIELRVPADDERIAGLATPVAIGLFIDVPDTPQPHLLTPATERANGYYSAVKNELRADPAADRLDYAFTPVVLRSQHTDAEDGYAVVIRHGEEPTALWTQDEDGAMRVDVHVRDYLGGGNAPVTPSCAGFAFFLFDAGTLAAVASDPDARVTDHAAWSTERDDGWTCVGDVDEDRMHLAITDHVPAGFYAAAAYLGVEDRVNGADSAWGYHSLTKNAIEDLPVADRLDETFTPFLLVGAADDADGDGLDNDQEAFFGTDPLDADSDGDGVSDGEEVDAGLDGRWTSPVRGASGVSGGAYSPIDFDGDGHGDDAETHGGSDPANWRSTPQNVDGDATPNALDNVACQTILPVLPQPIGRQTLYYDSDDDGLSDAEEVAYGTNAGRDDPTCPDGGGPAADTDGDGLHDVEEIFTYRTNPRVGDTDGDGILDGAEAMPHGRGSIVPHNAGTNPRGEYRLEYVHDTIPPTLTFDSPRDGAFVNGDVLLAGSATDTYSGIHFVAFRATAAGDAPGAWTRCEGRETWSCLWTLPIPPADADGIYDVEVRAFDRAGRASEIATHEIVVDRIGAAIACAPTVLVQDSGWLHDDGGMRCLLADANTGEASITYWWNDEPPATVTGTEAVIPIPEGINTLQAYGTDSAGNDGPTQSYETRLDTNDPALSISPVSPLFVSGNVTVGAIAEDDTSGVAAIRHRVTGEGEPTGPWTTTLGSSATVTVAANGASLVEFVAVDVANRTTSGGVTVRIDKLPPVTTAERTPAEPDAATGWYNAAIGRPTVTLTATDEPTGVSHSGVASTSVCVSGACSTPATSVTLPEGSAVTVGWNSVDRAGNVEALNTPWAPFQIDVTAPSLWVNETSIQLGENGWVDAAPVFHVATEDAVSGVDARTYRVTRGGVEVVAPTAVPADGRITIGVEGRGVVLEVTVVDRAGNVATGSTGAYDIDTTAPSVGAPTLSHAADGLAGWHQTAPTVTATGADATSGVARTECRVDGGAWTTGGVTVPEGLHDVDCRAVDNAGHASSESPSVAVKVDLTPPYAAINLTPEEGPGGWFTSTPVATFGLADGTSNATGAYAIAGPVPSEGSATDGSSVLLPDGDGVRITLTVTDDAGWTSTATSGLIRVDTDAPTTGGIEVTPASPDGADGVWYATTPTVNATSSDAVSGVAFIECHLGDGAYQLAPITLGNGIHQVTCRAVDNAGNRGNDVTSAYIRVDTAAPTGSIDVPSPNGDNGWHNTPPLVTFDASDPLSDVAQMSYRVLHQGAAVAAGSTSAGGNVSITTEGTGIVVELTVTDQAGHVSVVESAPFKVDLTAPAAIPADLVTVTSTPDPTDRIDGAAGAAEPGATLYVRAGADCDESLLTQTIAADGSFGFDLTGDVPEVCLHVRDPAGLVSGVLRVLNDVLPPTPPLDVVATTAAGGTIEVSWAPPASGFDSGGEYRVYYRSEIDPHGDGYTLVATVPGTETSWRSDALPDAQRHTFHVAATDGVGHESDASDDATAIADATAPVSVCLPPGVDAPAWLNQPVSVQCEGHDPFFPAGRGSGFDRITYEVAGGEETRYDGPVTIEREGVTPFVYRATDVAGNRESAHTHTYRIDLTPPATTALLNPAAPDGDAGWYTSKPTLTLTCEDGEDGETSGCAATLVGTGGAMLPYAAPLPFVDGQHTVAYRSTDRATNAEEEQSISFRVDTRAPSVTYATDPAIPRGLPHGSGHLGWFLTPTTLTLDASDDGSGVARIEYWHGDGDIVVIEGERAVVQLREGEHTIAFRAIDVAGNAGSVEELRYAVDLGAPATSASTPGGFERFESGRWIAHGVPVILGCDDAVSGCHVTKFGFDAEPALPYLSGLPIDMPDGCHELRYASSDRAGHQEGTQATPTICVDRVAPLARLGPDRTVGVGVEVAFPVVADDPGVSDATGSGLAWVEIDYGDGATERYEPSTGTQHLPAPAFHHTYTRYGIFTVTLTVQDIAGASGEGGRLPTQDVMTLLVQPAGIRAIDHDGYEVGYWQPRSDGGFDGPFTGVAYDATTSEAIVVLRDVESGAGAQPAGHPAAWAACFAAAATGGDVGACLTEDGPSNPLRTQIVLVAALGEWDAGTGADDGAARSITIQPAAHLDQPAAQVDLGIRLARAVLAGSDDWDGDGSNNQAELAANSALCSPHATGHFGPNPVAANSTLTDWDGDGLTNDFEDATPNTAFPLDKCNPDTDLDGIDDPTELGLWNGVEGTYADPRYPDYDHDQDGVVNFLDPWPLDALRPAQDVAYRLRVDESTTPPTVVIRTSEGEVRLTNAEVIVDEETGSASVVVRSPLAPHEELLRVDTTPSSAQTTFREPTALSEDRYLVAFGATADGETPEVSATTRDRTTTGTIGDREFYLSGDPAQTFTDVADSDRDGKNTDQELFACSDPLDDAQSDGDDPLRCPDNLGVHLSRALGVPPEVAQRFVVIYEDVLAVLIGGWL